MRLLVADDDILTHKIIRALLTQWGYRIVTACDGNEAWDILKSDNCPKLVLLDWMMPGMDGAEICREVRRLPHGKILYLIFLTGKGRKEDIVGGFEAGANDYIVKPFDYEELRGRVNVGRNMVELQSALADRIKELEQAFGHIKTLQGILPICSYCKKIRDDQNYWQQLETYFAAYSDLLFSHGICPDCYDRHVKPELDELQKIMEKT